MSTIPQPKPEIIIPTWVPPIFQDTCGRHYMFDIDHPFPKSSWLWATDGAILIRHKLSKTERAELPPAWSRKNRQLPDVLEIWQQFSFPASRPYLAHLPPGNYEPTECPKCGGVGAYTAFYDCEECDGEGMIESCFGVTIRERPTVVLLSKFVGLLLKHGVSCVSAGESTAPIYFVGNGFEGLLMPCKETTS